MIHVEFEADKIIYGCHYSYFCNPNKFCQEGNRGFCQPECDSYQEIGRKVIGTTEIGSLPITQSDESCRYSFTTYSPILIAGDFEKVVFEDGRLTIGRKHYQLEDYNVHKLSVNGKTYILQEEWQHV